MSIIINDTTPAYPSDSPYSVDIKSSLFYNVPVYIVTLILNRKV